MANEHSQIVPSMQPTSTVADFKFWCQKVLPLVYDDSLSYYEVLNKMVVYLNQVIDNINADTANVAELEDDFLLLQTYVNNFFDDIDQLVTYTERAEAAQTAAASSAISAATSASNAATSASNSAGSASSAATSALSALDAKDAAVAAKTATETALASAQTAATNAAASATAASNSATSASGSATNAAASAASALQNFQLADAARVAAQSSETNAAQSAASAAISAESAISIENPIMPKSQYGEDFEITKNGLTVTKRGNKINFKGTCTAPFSLRPFSDDYFAHGQFMKPAFFKITNSSEETLKPTFIVFETTFTNNLQTDGTRTNYIYSSLYTAGEEQGQEQFIIRQYLRMGNTIPANFESYFINRTELTQNILDAGIAPDLFINAILEPVDFDIVFSIRACNSTYIL